MSERNPSPVEEWGTRIGVILAVAGSAVGLGNFLRFPGQASQNGGGAFMIPYFIAFLLLGIPVCWAEWTMGKYAGRRGVHSLPAIFELLGGRAVWRYLGVIGVLIPVVIYMYYVVIESWCFAYALSYLLGWMDLGTDPSLYAENSKAFFSKMVELTHDGMELDFCFFTWLFVFSVNFYLIYKGLTGGIEKFCMVAMPIMALCAVVVLVRVLTLGTPNPEFPDRNVLNGLGFMWNPKPTDSGESWLSAIFDPKVWMAATGQIFFSLSVGFGIIMNYASYLKKDDDVVLSGLTASSTNEFFEVGLGGLITIPAAFVFLGAAGAVGGTFGLGFNTLPVVFQYMPGGALFGFLWFFMLFLAAITSSLSMLQPAIAFLEESLGIKRRASVTLLGLVTALGSLFVLYFSKDLTALDTMDFWVGTLLIFVLAALQTVLFAWVFGADRGVKYANSDGEIKIPRVTVYVLRYVAPLYLLILFVAWCFTELPNYAKTLAEGGVPLYSVLVIFALFLFFLKLAHLGGKNWQQKVEAARNEGRGV